MGWNPFEDDEVTTVGTSIMRVIQDKDLVDSTKAALITALYGQTDIVDEILEANVNGISVRIERMYQYAKNNSPYGLPTGEIYANTQGKDEIQAVLNALEGQEVLIDYHRFGAPNGIHMGWMNLIEYHGYDPATNKLMILSAEKGTPVYLKDMVLELPAWMADTYSKDAVAIWGTPANSGYTQDRSVATDSAYSGIYYKASPPIFTNGLLHPQLKVTYTWEEPLLVSSSGMGGLSSRKHYESRSFSASFSMPYRDVDTTSGYFHAKYLVAGITKYWMYKYGAGTYPALDAVFVDSQNVFGDYFPNIYFRLGKVNLAANTATDHYRVNKKLTKYIGVDYDTVSEAIHANPDIGDVEQGFITMGVPADSTDPLEQEYLFNFFDALHSVSDATVRTSSYNYNDVGEEQTAYRAMPGKYVQRNISPASETITIKDSVFKMDLSNSGIIKTRVSGSIGNVGAVTSGKAAFTYQTPVQAEYGSDTVSHTATRFVSYRFYRKQISANFYEEIQVVGASMKYWVYEGHNVVQGDENAEILLIPIDRAILKKLNARDAEKLISRSLHFVFNSRVVTDVAWYQQEWFGTLLVIVAIVITIVTLGGDGGASLEAALVALAAMSAEQLLIWIAMKIIIYIAVREAFKLFVKAVGVEIAMIAAIIAMAYGMQLGASGTTGSFAGYEVTAETMLQTVSGISQGINTELRRLSTDLLEDASIFNLLKKEKLDLLDKARNLLDSDSILSPFVVLGESPEDYFKRTVHSGNIGVYLIDDVHNYVARNLQLPDFSTSVGGPKYVAA